MSQEFDRKPFLTPAENAELLRLADQVPRRSLLLAPEDIAVGDWVAVHSFKRDPEEMVPIMGQAAEVKAVNLPFLVTTFSSDPEKAPYVLDVRFLNFMRVSQEFERAQFVPRKASPEAEKER